MDEDDLRSALTMLADRAPEPRDAAAEANRRVLQIRAARRRVGLLSVAAAVVAVAGASGIVAISRPAPTGPPAATSGSTLGSVSTPTDPLPGGSVARSGRTTARPDPTPRPLLGYDWSTPAGEPELPVSVRIPPGYTVRQMKFYPQLDYSTVTYSEPGNRGPSFGVTVGRPEAFVATGGGQSTTPSSQTPTTKRRGVTTAAGLKLLVSIESSVPALTDSLAGSLSVAPTPIDLGIRVSQMPTGDYIGGASIHPGNPASLATVDIITPSPPGVGTRTLTLRIAAGLPAPVETVRVRTSDGHQVTVHVGADATSWILLGDGRAIVLTGYPLSGTMLHDAVAFPQSTLLPLLAGATASR